MAIQNRRGAYSDFDKSKLVPGEMAFVLSGDTTTSKGSGVYACFGTNNVQRLSTKEEVDAMFDENIEDAKDTIISEVEDSFTDQLATKANASSVYTKTEADGKYATAANLSTLSSTVSGHTSSISTINAEIEELSDDISTVENKISQISESVTITGKKAVAGSNYIPNNGTSIQLSANDVCRVAYFSCSPNTTYVVTKILSNAFRVAYSNVEPSLDSPVRGTVQNTSGTSITITTDSTAAFLAIYYAFNDSDEDAIYNSIIVSTTNYIAVDNYARGIAETNRTNISNLHTKFKTKSYKTGAFINLNPISTITAKYVVDTKPTENTTRTIKQYGKNMATYAQSANISANKNDTTYFAIDLYMQKGHAYTISYKQDVSLISAIQNSISVDIGGTVYLSPTNFDSGVVVFKFIAPVTKTANVGVYTYNLSSAINVSEFQIEHGDEKTDYVEPTYRANTVSITPTTEYVNIEIVPFDGINNICCHYYGHMEISCYENDIEIYNEINKELIRWDIACGNIVCIGDSLTDGLYSPINKGKVKQNYPYYLGRLLNAEVTNIGKSGSYPSEVYSTIYPSQDFSKYDAVIIWLGTNGGLFNDFSNGSQADYYCKIIDGIKSQKSDVQMFIGTVFTTGEIDSGVAYASVKETNATIKAISETYSIPVIDFSDLTSTGYRTLHNMQDNTHFGKSGNIFIANRIANFMQKYFEEDVTRCEFGLFSKN